MRRRQEHEGHVWLGRNGLEDARGRVAGQTADSQGFAAALRFLTRDLGMLVEFAQEGDQYRMRCYPRRGGASWRGAVVAASYSCAQLTSIPDAARADYLRLESGDCRPLYAAREVVRWVE